MPFDWRYRTGDAAESDGRESVRSPPAPGRSTLTSKLFRRPIVQIFRTVEGSGIAGDAEEHVGRAAGSSGSPLPADLRDRFEASLGADLSGVRIHTGADSEAAAAAVAARAYAVGNDIHFGAGQYDPSSADGQLLIAHEVAHTVQQGGATPSRQNKLEVSSAGDAAEVEADAAASAMVTGAPFEVASTSPALARKENTDTGEEQKEEKPKFPKWVGDKDQLEIPYKAGTVKLDMSENPSAGMEWKGSAEHDFFKIDHTLTPPPMIAPGVFVDAAITANAGLSVTGTAGFSAGWEDVPGYCWEGPPEKQFTLKGMGVGKVSIGLAGSVKLGVSAGVPMGRIAGGAELTLGASASASASLIAGGTRTPDGSWSGNIQLVVGGEAKLEAKGALYVDAVIATDRYNLYTYEIGSHTIGSASIACIAMVDLATGKPVDMPPIISYKWNGLPKGKEVGKRKLSESERAKLLPVNDGASGAPSYVPEEVECENDGAGGAASDCGPAPAPPPPTDSGASRPRPEPARDEHEGGGGAGGASGGNDGAHGSHG